MAQLCFDTRAMYEALMRSAAGEVLYGDRRPMSCRALHPVCSRWLSTSNDEHAMALAIMRPRSSDPVPGDRLGLRCRFNWSDN